MFDQFQNSIDDAIISTLNTDKVTQIVLCKMQDYEFNAKYSPTAIYIRWCLTYLNRDE